MSKPRSLAQLRSTPVANALLLALGGWPGLLIFLQAAEPATPQAPFTVPTFHSLGLYWSPAAGEPDREALVRYRRQGSQEWEDGLPMRYNAIDKTDLDGADYRGSLVNLNPATTYEVQLKVSGTDSSAQLTARTWSEEFSVGERVVVTNRSTPLVITDSGTANAWRVYDGRGATIDVAHQHDACINVNASYVILRGFTLRGAGTTNLAPKRIIGAIRVEGGHDIVIEDCDISDWGRLNPETSFGFDYDSAIFSNRAEVERLIVQRCKLHHPTFDGSTWYEPTYPTHTMGPQYITLFNTKGNHVIRYNECWSDLEHMCNDGIGGGSNGSFRGAPGPDSDIYGNLVSHCWDDGIEVEGGSRNVRLWNNYISQSMMMIGNAPVSIGPLYIWRNVVALSQSQPGAGGANFLKMGFADGEHWMTGHMYIFHNTLYQSDGWLPTGGLGGNRIVKHATSRNNILHVRNPRDYSASANKQNSNNDFDYDLYNGRIPDGSEVHGVRGDPLYAPDAGFDFATRTGRFQLAPASPGAAAGLPIPNFSDGYTGKAPDMGAHQRGAPPMRFGVSAGQVVGAEPGSSPTTLKPTVEVEEDVYTYTPANNGAGPLWCGGSTCLVRIGDDVFASGLETLADAKPLNNCRWTLYRREAHGWVLQRSDPEGRTREPCPLAAFPDGRLFLSVNPTLSKAESGGGPARPEILRFSAGEPKGVVETLLPRWDGEPQFSEHSYRSFAADASARELVLFQNIGYTHAEWAFLDGSGAWAARGQLRWPQGVEYPKPGPIRVCYPNVAIMNRAVHFCGVSDIIEPYPEWRAFKKQLTGQEWDYDFRRLFYTWTPDITRKGFADWVEVASRDKTCGWIMPGDLWVAPDGAVHIVWTERALDERLRAKFFPEAKQSHSLNYALLRDGKVVLRKTLLAAEEGKSFEIPSAPRFQVTTDRRLILCCYVSGRSSEGKALSENQVMQILPGGGLGPRTRVPLTKPFTSYFTATPRAGSPPSDVLDLLGQREGMPLTMSYARVRLR